MAITNHISFCWSVKHGFEFLVIEANPARTWKEAMSDMWIRPFHTKS